MDILPRFAMPLFEFVVCTDEPDYSDILDFDYDWSKKVYGELEELKPEDV
jgi:hypothetical protein